MADFKVFLTDTIRYRSNTLPRSHLLVYRALLLLWLAAVTYLALTGDQYPLVSQINDKVAHGVTFYLLALLLDFSFPGTRFNGAKVAFLLGYGALLEAAQLATPSRDPSFYDFLADAAGIASYAVTIPLTKRIPVLARRWESGR